MDERDKAMKALRRLIIAGAAGTVAALTAIAGKAEVAAAANPYGIVGGEVSLVSGGNSLVAALIAAASVAAGILIALKLK